MEGLGTPDLIIRSGASPHEYTLRPSEAAALEDADLVFWIGPDLTPWLGDAVEALTTDAVVTELLEADETIVLDFREGALFEAHHHEDGGSDDHADEDHEDHADEEHSEDDHHDHDEAAHEGHDHGAHDPHAWLSPRNAATWLNVIAGRMSAADPANASAYFENAAAGRAEIEALIGEVDTMLDPVRGGQFIVFHDAYQYFENAFDMAAAGAISIGDASDPSPSRITQIRDRVTGEGIDCVMTEPQFNPRLVETVLDGTQAATTTMDPLGFGLDIGPELYPGLIRNLAASLRDCL